MVTDTDRQKLNILVTLDVNYIKYLNVMLSSLVRSEPSCLFDVYLLHTEIPEAAFAETNRLLKDHGRLLPIRADGLKLENAPTTSRYPKEIYYRIFAAKFLPKTIKRVLYLDPDVIVNGSVLNLYHTPLKDYYFAAASHTGAFLTKINSMRLNTEVNTPYINSGVMLMNLELLRKEQDEEEVFAFIKKHKKSLILPDQDVISALYGNRIYTLDAFRYNMTERLYRAHAPFEKQLDMEWVRKNSVIIHYVGRNKPWKARYSGKFDVFYKDAEKWMNENLLIKSEE